MKPGCAVALLDAPGEFELSDPPPGCVVVRVATSRRDLDEQVRADVTVAFVRSRLELDALMDALLAHPVPMAPLWLSWPRRAAGHESDLTDGVVRQAGLTLGLVDTKVAALDNDWSALRFSVRRARSATTTP